MKKQEIYNTWKNLKLDKRDINQIILSVTNFSKNQLFLAQDIEEKYIEKIIDNFNRLKKWEPLEYITNNSEFYSLDFYVDSRVLIPRNDTEVMVDNVLKNNWTYILIDVWTWSSCIAISILKNTSSVKKCFVTDISKDALNVSKINIKKYDLGNRIIQINWNLLDNFEFNTNILCSNWDLDLWNLVITANLPYIKNQDYKNMDIWTIKYNPDLALYWWEKTWFELYEKLIYQCFKLKNIYNINTFTLFIEIWFDQKDYSKNFLESLGLEFDFFKDNSWIDRCIKIYF